MHQNRLRGPSVLGVLVLIAGCSQQEPPEEKLVAAADNVVEAREDIKEAEEEVVTERDELKERRAAVKRAKAELKRAREDLAEAEQRLVSARQRYERRATDDAIFRLVQSKLLEDSTLQQAAIGVDVYDRSLTLTGVVNAPEIREHAAMVARSTAGVLSVENDIIVDEDRRSATAGRDTE